MCPSIQVKLPGPYRDDASMRPGLCEARSRLRNICSIPSNGRGRVRGIDRGTI